MSTLIRHAVQTLSPYIPGEQPNHNTLIKLNTNENPYPPSPMVDDVLNNICANDLREYPDPTNSNLRHRLSQIYGVLPSQIFIGNGSDEILALATRAFVENDQTIGCCDTSYSLYSILAQILNIRVRFIKLDSNFKWLKPEGTSDALFFLANPSVPTGTLIKKKDVKKFCESSHGVVVIDEAYAEFSEENCIDLALEMNNVIVSRSLSKSFSLAGIRLGYAIGPEPLINAMAKIKDSYNISILTQRVALAALIDLDHMKKNCTRICLTREEFRKELKTIGWRAFPSQANFLLVEPKAVSATVVFEKLREREILVRYFPEEKTKKFLRITISSNPIMKRLLSEIHYINGRFKNILT